MTSITLPVPVSFEFFPPNTPVGSEKLKTVVQELGATQPEFFSVTYGAGGSTREKTLSTVSDIAALGHEAAPHLSCIGSTREGIAQILFFRADVVCRTSYADKKGKYQDQTGLTLPFVQGSDPPRA